MTPWLLGLVALGGGCGALARYGLVALIRRRGGGHPTAILAVNLAGSAAAGGLFGILPAAWHVAGHAGMALIFAGFLGALTTVSAFSLDVLDLVRAGRYPRALGYSGLSLTGCPLLAALGLWLAGGAA